jgi:hypothetical protein
MPAADAIGTEEFDSTAEEYAQGVLDNWTADNDEEGLLRVVVWNGTQQDTTGMAAAVINA